MCVLKSKNENVEGYANAIASRFWWWWGGGFIVALIAGMLFSIIKMKEAVP
jgi:hypothetical protein